MTEPRRRFTLGILIPLVSLLAGAAVVFSISRVLLAASESLAPVIGLLIAMNVLVAAALASGFPGRRTIAALLVAVGVPILAVGVVGAVVGPRKVESLVEGAEEPAAPEPPAPAESPAAESPAPGSPAPAEEPAAGALTVVARDIAFDTDLIELPADAEVTITFDNQDEAIPHNVAIYTDETAAEPIFVGEIFPGVARIDYTFRSPGPGTYFFRCDVHPTIMTGMVTVG